MWAEEHREMNRGVRLGVIGSFGLALGTVRLLVSDADPPWMFHPAFLLVGVIFLALDLRSFPDNSGTQVFTYKFWTGRPYPKVITIVIWSLCLSLLALTTYSWIEFYSATSHRTRLITGGEIADARVQKLNYNSRAHEAFVTIVLASGGNEEGKKFHIRTKDYWGLREGSSIRVVHEKNNPASYVPAEIALEAPIPIEITWMILLGFFIYGPTWYLLLKPRLSPASFSS